MAEKASEYYACKVWLFLNMTIVIQLEEGKATEFL